MQPIEEIGDIEPAVASHGDHALLMALIRTLEERGTIAHGEVIAMSERIFQEIIAENKQRYRAKMQAGIDKCLEILADPGISESDREARQNMLVFFQSEMEK